MTDQGGPGSHVLYQDFVVPTDVTIATISFQHFISNQAGVFSNPNSLDYNVIPNQQARVDIIDPTIDADPFTMNVAAILANLFQASADGAYTVLTADVTALFAANAGATLRLRFAEVDNQLFFNNGIDAVSIVGQAVPEPATLALLSVAALGVGRRMRRRAEAA